MRQTATNFAPKKKFKITCYHFAANLSGSPHLISHLFVCFLPPRNKLKKPDLSQCGLGLADLRDRVTSGLGTDKIYIYLICGLGLPDLRDRVTSGLGTDEIYISYLWPGVTYFVKKFSWHTRSLPGRCKDIFE